jgi:hypothetical protein
VLDAALLEVLAQARAQQQRKVAEDGVARRVALARALRVLLARALCHHHHGLAAHANESLDVLEHAGGPVDLEVDLGHQTHVHLAAGQCGVRGDEAALAAHEAHDAHAPGRALGLCAQAVRCGIARAAAVAAAASPMRAELMAP